MINRLSIEFRHKQIYRDGDINQPVIVKCNADGTAEYIDGIVPGSEEWIDMTEHTEGLDDITLNWRAAEAETDIEFGSNYQKGVSADLRFTGAAFEYIHAWLMEDPCQILNSVEARIYDHECKKYLRIFELKLDNIKYSPEDNCILVMPLRERDDVWHSFQKTIIEDNWQNWFNQKGTSTKEHPTFGMIIERKPKFYLAIYAALVYVVGILSAGILVTLPEGKRWIRRTLGFTYFAPAPLVRDYIKNICDKYGYTWDTIFDDKPENPYRDLCLFFPASSTYKNFDGFTSPSTKYIWDNRTVLPFSKFLNQLKDVFNAEWYVTPNKKLVFQHKGYFDNQAPIYDFTTGTLELFNLHYSFNGKKKPAYGDYQYQVDPQDTCSNEPKWRYNAIVDYDGNLNNPLLEGNVSKPFQFAMTAFHEDGTGSDWLEEGIKMGRTIANLAIAAGLALVLTATLSLGTIAAVALIILGYTTTNDFVNNFFNNADLNGLVRTSSSEINFPRLLLWDRLTAKDKAKVVRVQDPEKNPVYNTDDVDYYEEHPSHDSPGYFGTTVRDIPNYPMFVEEKFKGNLYDRFHEYDNPLRNPKINQTWEGSVDLCCEWMDLLGAWENDYVKIGAVVVLEDRKGRKIKGRIEEIEPSYKSGTINLKGTVLK